MMKNTMNSLREANEMAECTFHPEITKAAK